jgi:hypothetical protein
MLSFPPMKVLALIDDANAVCCRYRIEAFDEAMAERDMSLEVVRFNKGILGRISDLYKVKHADVVILQRKLLPLWQISLLRHWARRLIFDVDDAVFQRDSNSRKGSVSRSRSAKFRAIVSKADLGLWCGPNSVNLKRGSTPLGAYSYEEIIPRLKVELDALISKRGRGEY